jgi:glycosyltransferase involved in cell wall biosynthesis
MKVLFDHALPFALAEGGVRVQIEQTKAALEALGVQVEWLRWWDAGQTGDVIHFFGTPAELYLRQARLKRKPVILTSWFSETCNRTPRRLALQRCLIKTALALPLGEGVKAQLNWRVFQQSDRVVVGLEAERAVLEHVYGVEPARIAVIPLGLPELFRDAQPGARAGDHLLCVGTLTEVKGQVELAGLARRAGVPVLFVGNPYDHRSPYWNQFASLVDGALVRHQAHVADPRDLRAIYQAARGFVLYSRFENWCLAASEAAACGLPLLLRDLPWSRERFGGEAQYFPRDQVRHVDALRMFYSACPGLPAPVTPRHSWRDVALQLQRVYQQALHSSAAAAA